MAKAPTTADLKHKVTICTSADVVIDAGRLVITRTGVREARAQIRESRESQFSRDGVAIRESRDSASHKIIIRYDASRPISAAAWIYEKRLKSEPRWYKVLGISDLEEAGLWHVLRCRLVEKSDDLSAPASAPAAGNGSQAPASPFQPMAQEGAL